MAIWKSRRIVFSLSPWYLLTIELAEMLKNVVLHSEATAFASIVFPVPGGPKRSIPFHGSRILFWNSSGSFRGSWIASFITFFADCIPIMSENFVCRFFEIISDFNCVRIFFSSSEFVGGKFIIREFR